MSTLKVNQTKNKLRQKFEAHLDLSDITSKDADRDSKILSRCLAALGVQLKTACSDEDAAKAVWDGGDDNGVDAAYFDSAESRVVVVQAKWINKGTGEPEAKEIGAFTRGVWDIVEQDTTMFHQRLQSRLSDIMLRMGTPGIAVHMVVISTGASSLAPHGQAVIDKLLKELNGDDPTPVASADVLGLVEVYNGLASESGSGAVSLESQLFDWSYLASPYAAYFGLIDGLQLKAWWKQHGRRVVASNIRHALGATEVNVQIKQTASTAPENFWYFNNGITVVAEEVLKAPAGAASRTAGNFAFKGASIVNGAQTVSSLAGIDDDVSLGKVRVSIRVIVLDAAPPDFGRDVTRTNNLQNRIEPRDFAAQDPEQTRLRREMAMEGVDYQFVRSEEAAVTGMSCELLEVTTALACATGDPALAVQVKTGLGRFFADLSKPPYKTLFNPSTSGARAFNATLVQRAIDEWIDSKKKSLVKKSGPRWGVLVHGNRILASLAFSALGQSKLSKPIAAFSSSFKVDEIAPILQSAYDKMVDAIKQNYEGRHLAVLFKNPSNSKHVFDLSQ
ncbi:MAG TPA: AIPR family protein [Gemmatimonadaceae bacterium]|nr:AIPR family protein [Gemmatimonadaceae bacterium]